MSKEDFLYHQTKNPNTFKRGLLIWSNKDANTKIKCLQIEILNGLNLISIDEKKAFKILIESNKYYLPSTYQTNHSKQMDCNLKQQPKTS